MYTFNLKKNLLLFVFFLYRLIFFLLFFRYFKSVFGSLYIGCSFYLNMFIPVNKYSIENISNSGSKVNIFIMYISISIRIIVGMSSFLFVWDRLNRAPMINTIMLINHIIWNVIWVSLGSFSIKAVVVQQKKMNKCYHVYACVHYIGCSFLFFKNSHSGICYIWIF
jgi:hypothetical protein